MMADDEILPAPAAPGGRRVRLFLMVAGGLAAPSLALAAFFFTSGSDPTPPARPAAAQAGRVTGGAPIPRPPAPVATTTSTTASAAPTVPARDPFAALVSQAPSAGNSKG
jgi:hypothetical protein